jgi:lipid-binding SYLF domain-containing protein
MNKLLSTMMVVTLAGPATLAWAEAPAAAQVASDKTHHGQEGADVKEARQAKVALQTADPKLDRLFDGAAAYAVFPSVGKGAVGVGGAHGNGVLFERGVAVGKASLTQLTVGLQVGGQVYTEVVFFENAKAVEDFKKGEYTMATQVSAVAVTKGASANVKYFGGVSVFTLTKGGLMAEASVGGQKFAYQAYPLATTSER